MNLIIIFLSTIFFNFQAFAESKTFFQGKKPFALHLTDDVWVSEDCHKNCQALTAPALSKKGGNSAQPAADFCQSANGKYLVVKDSLGMPEGLCQFSDGSFILAWDYFKKFKTK